MRNGLDQLSNGIIIVGDHSTRWRDGRVWFRTYGHGATAVNIASEPSFVSTNSCIRAETLEYATAICTHQNSVTAFLGGVSPYF